jgi:hypothetical protein
MYSITNTSKGPRGIWSRGRHDWLQPGETKALMPDDPTRTLRNRDLTAEPVGEVPDPPADLAKAVAEKPAPKRAPRRKSTPKRRTITKAAK